MDLDPGTQVRVHYKGPADYGSIRITYDGAVVAADGLRSGTSKLVTVPVGAVSIRLRLYHLSRTEVRELTCVAGEVLDVVFELD